MHLEQDPSNLVGRENKSVAGTMDKRPAMSAVRWSTSAGRARVVLLLRVGVCRPRDLPNPHERLQVLQDGSGGQDPQEARAPLPRDAVSKRVEKLDEKEMEIDG